ncbi:unnamed protein product [Prorocentrum cordatum]|uniref:Palmitoyltransferase n=1 Tax=Prorocentrum cordatum TaxID=2364126 RepID=A0ABN9PS22_9DINO|nr:unnamed protein product [Polarella glacialis]
MTPVVTVNGDHPAAFGNWQGPSSFETEAAEEFENVDSLGDEIERVAQLHYLSRCAAFHADRPDGVNDVNVREARPRNVAMSRAPLETPWGATAISSRRSGESDPKGPREAVAAPVAYPAGRERECARLTAGIRRGWGDRFRGSAKREARKRQVLAGNVIAGGDLWHLPGGGGNAWNDNCYAEHDARVRMRTVKRSGETEFTVACAARFVGSLATASGTAALFPALLAANAAAFGFALRGREAGSDPGCLGPRTLQPQHERLRRQALEGALDLWRRPLEEQVDAARLRDVELRAVRSALGDSHKEAAGEGLERLERLQQRLGQQRRLLASAGRGRLAGGESWQPLRCCGSRPEQGGGGPCELQPLILSAEDAEGELARMAGLLPGLARSTAGQLGRLRLLELLGRGGGPGAEYAAAVQRGDLQHLCTVCRRCRTLRSYHCKECGRCVERLDHHCPWIDNCVGLGNQRLFYAFLVCIVLALGLFLLLGGVELWSIGERAVGESLEAVPLMGLLVVLALDAVFGGFAAMLLVRQTAYMVANVTTYEVLVVPKHVQRRFPCRRTGDRLWFLRGCSLSSGLASCVGYWSRDLRRDLDDFGDPAEGVAPLE